MTFTTFSVKKTWMINHLMQISMKTFFKTLLAALTLVAAVSCAKETPAPKDPAAQPEANLVPYTLNIGTQAAKSFIDKDSTTIVWEEGDRLGVIDDVNATVHEFTFVSSDGTSASFDGSLNEGASTLYVVYPYDENSSVAATTVSASLPAAQQVSANRTARGALLAVGTAPVNQRVSLKNAFGLVQVTVKHSDVKEIVLDGEGLSGVVSLDATTGEISGVPASSGPVTLTPPQGQEYFQKDSIYYAAVLPGTTPAGEFSLEIRREMDADLASSATYTFTKAVTVPRNGGFYFNTDNAAFSWSWHITNKAELFAWNAAYEKWSKLDKVYIENDINMESDPWESHNFKGVLDGQDHKLYNFVTAPSTNYTGFIADLTGTVKNLVLGSSNGSDYDGVSLVGHATDSTYWCNVASVAARLGNNAKIENVTNFATVEVLAAENGRTRVGGIAAFAIGSGTSVVSCKNYGSIKNSASTASAAQIPMGGILASAENAVTISECYNYGDIVNNNDKVQWIGGIMGVTNGPVAIGKAGAEAFKATITDCHNEGNITANAGTALRIGGIVGNLTGGDLSGCINLGSITNNANVANYLGGVVGCVAKITSNTLTDCTNGAISDRTKGNVVYAAESASKNSYIGGIIGAAVDSTGLILSGCKNYCNLSTTHEYVANLAGIAGCIEKSGKTVRLSDCYNYGTISNTCTETVGDNRVAGLVAYCIGTETNPVVIENSTNEAAVTSSKPGAAAAFVAGIAARCAYVTLDGVVNTSAAPVSGTHTAGSSNQNVGGLIGYASAGLVIKGASSNAAKITSTGTGICLAGGLMGNAVGANISGTCSNSGEVYGESSTGENQIGGLSGSLSTSTVTGFTNSGAVHANTVSTLAFEAKVGGVVGNSNSENTYILCENAATGSIYVEGDGPSGKYRNLGGIVGVSFSDVLDACINRAEINNKTVGYAFRAGGFIGYCNGSTVKCDSGESVNEGAVHGVSKTNDSCLGGIVAVSSGTGCTIKGTSEAHVVNRGKIYSESSNRSWHGGILGWINGGKTNRIEYADNQGEVYKTTGGGHSAIGGIIGLATDATSTSVLHCINSGAITDKSSANLYRWAAGIVGKRRGNGTMTISNCQNSGKVTMTAKSTNANSHSVGGMIASGNRLCTITDNTNTGDISVTNSANGLAHAGGIFGSDMDPDTGSTAATANTITGNTNSGTITAICSGTPVRVGAGGIVGRLNYNSGVAVITGNTNAGNVSATSGSTVLSGASATGGSGAIVGDMQTNASNTVTATIKKTVTVGGVSYSAAEAAGTLSTWLCPNGANVSATYVD